MKPEWGAKRTCQSCGASFYDMRRAPIVCPKCEATFDPEAFTKARRSRPQPVEEKEKKPPARPASGDDIESELPEGDDDFEDVGDDGGEDEELIEDASELGEDDPVVSTVGGKDDDDRN